MPAIAFNPFTGGFDLTVNHNLLSALHSDTTAASAARGALITGQGASATWSILVKPSVLSDLSHDGTDISWVTANGTGNPARTTNVVFVTPTLGVAVATSLNGNTFTTGTYTLTGVAGKTLTFNKSLTLDGTDATTMTFPTTSATIARTDAANTFTGHQTIEGVTSTGATGTGKLVFDGTPTLVTPVLGVASCTSIASAAGSASAPSITFGDTNTGIYRIVANYITFTTSSNGKSAINDSGQWVFSNNVTLGFNGSNNDPTIAPDLILRRATAATLQLGSDLNGAAISQILQACNGITGQNRTGGNLTLASGKGTDLGAVSSLIFQTPTVGGATSGTAQSLATRLTIDSAGLTIADAMNVVLNTSTGTKFGTATTQKLSFYGVTPIVCAVLATGTGATVDNVITALQNLGLVKQS